MMEQNRINLKHFKRIKPNGNGVNLNVLDSNHDNIEIKDNNNNNFYFKDWKQIKLN